MQQEGDSPIKIQKVMKGSAAEKAGVKAGDVVIKVNGKKVGDAGSLSDHVQKSDGAVRLEVKRDGKNVTFKVVPKKMEGNHAIHGIGKIEALARTYCLVRPDGATQEKMWIEVRLCEAYPGTLRTRRQFSYLKIRTLQDNIGFDGRTENRCGGYH